MKRSKHALSYYQNQSMNMGSLTPIGCMEVLPGDTIQHAVRSLVRLSELVSPVMHPVHAKIHHFFVPYRLIWDDFEDFITKGPEGTSNPVYPTISLAGCTASSLGNYLGLPVFSSTRDVSALPFRAYALIFNEYYRDQDLVDEVDVDFSSGTDTTTNTDLLTAAWEKDRFTSARPWTQKGPEVTIPLAGEAPIVTSGVAPTFSWSNQVNKNMQGIISSGAVYMATGGDSTDDLVFGDETGLLADLSDVPGVDVNDLRAALALQRWQEARAQYGSRYTEYLRYLGVKSSDARLQRPEYLGGGKQVIQFSEVLGTVNNDDTNLGQLGGHGIASVSSNRYRHFFEEHGIVISFMIVRPIAVYADGIPRMWNRRTMQDFWQMELQHIGQQELQNKEVYADSATPDGVFGFQDRYDEYRRNESRVAGEFATTLDYWNLARKFSAEPALNADFVTCIPDPRIFVSTTTDQLRCMISHSIQARRLVSKVGRNYIY
nr:MAG: major capsid protein [Microvirus sp.]